MAPEGRQHTGYARDQPEVPWIETLGAGPHGIVVEPTRVAYDSIFFFVAPYAEMQVQILDWVGIGVRAGYVWAPIEFNWSDEGPLDPPNLAPTGIYVGFTVAFGGITWIGVTPVDEIQQDAP